MSGTSAPKLSRHPKTKQDRENLAGAKSADVGYPHGRFQFCWYGWRGPWLRCFFERGGTAMFTLVYRWRIAIGPLDIRRWVDQADLPRLVAEHDAQQAARES